MTVLDLFAGPGGADLGMRSFGLDPLGIEWDDAACATRQAADLQTVQADVADLDPLEFPPVDGLWASPPCQDFSTAGKRAGLNGERGMLIHEVMRWAEDLGPDWIACEQVPPALPVWDLFAQELRTLGYRTWCGILNAAAFGVPQTRRRAILMASRRPFDLPEPTHAQHPQSAGLFGRGLKPWVTMAEALGWDGDDAALRNNSQERACVRGIDEPAGTIFFGARKNDVTWVLRSHQRDGGDEYHRTDGDSPASTLTASTRSWVWERPATTVCADARIPEPGWRGSPEDYADGDPTRSGDNAVRVTVEQAAILQGFPADYPFQGSKTAKFHQVGDAVPPAMAAAIVAPLLEAQGLAA